MDEATRRSMLAQDKPIIFFDGVCGLCDRFVTWVLKRDRRRIFFFSPLQGQTASRSLGIPYSEELLKTIVLKEDSILYYRSDAVFKILWQLGGIWKIVALLRYLPKGIRDWGYNMVSGHRYQWFGRSETCRLPRPEEKDRFLS